MQCDFSAMISPDSFGRFVLPSLERHARFLDHSIYHWDGPGEIPHLPILLGIEELDGIQWVPGDGNPNVASDRWFPYYEKIQAAGKNLALTQDLSKTEILRLLKNLSQKGLFICSRVESQGDADEIVAKAAEYARR